MKKEYRKLTSVLVLAMEVPEARFGGKTVSQIRNVFLTLHPMPKFFISIFLVL